jgi:hypothetical protein
MATTSQYFKLVNRPPDALLRGSRSAFIKRLVTDHDHCSGDGSWRRRIGERTIRPGEAIRDLENKLN